MPTAGVNGQRLFYEDTGGNAPVIAFSHGLFMDHTMFDAQVEALRDGWRCIRWDEPGHGQTGDASGPVFRQCISRGIEPTLSCDVISLNSGDMFAQMRLGLNFQRCMDNDPINAAGAMPQKQELTVRDAIAWGTINGAEAMGLGSRTGSLTPGKQGDVIVIGGTGLNMTPRPEMVGSVVFQANAASVRHVLVAGRPVKRDGKLLGVDIACVRRLADESRERVYSNVVAHGPLLPEAPPDYDEQLNQLGGANIARAHELAEA